ncbi:MAG TPA: sigma-70 family RNA polymerase sigma factor [Candidatus Paceibacterota bacterium]|nr:sigma-70 family RNA polymerase sigma factor [Candidatus Paceibacterota bacterium]
MTPHTQASDKELVARFKSGDESAFTEIYSRHFGRLSSIAYRLLQNRTEAEDIAQDALIRAHRGLHRFRGDSSLTTWLHHIVTNLAHNRYHYNRRRKRHASISIDEAVACDETGRKTVADLLACSERTPDQVIAFDEFSTAVKSCMERLKPEHRRMLIERNVKKRSYTEISENTGITLGTVKSQLARARRNLKNHLGKAVPDFKKEGNNFTLLLSARAHEGLIKAAV